MSEQSTGKPASAVADCPFARFVPADPSNYHIGTRQTFQTIVIHCTDGHGSAQNTAEMFATPYKMRDPPVISSSHFVVGQSPPEILQCVRLKDVAQHAHMANVTSVGIEHCARTPGELGPSDPGLPPTEEQYALSAHLVAWLCFAAGLEPTRDVIKGHAEADPLTTHKQCPTGCGWDWAKYMAMVDVEHSVLVAAALNS